MTMRNSYAPVAVDELTTADYNPNVLSDRERAQLVDELKRLGRVLKPIVARRVGGKLVIIDGEHTWMAAKAAGLDVVPVEVVEADEFEARRQTFKRNISGTNDPVKLGQMFRGMGAERRLSNRQLARELGVSEGSVRNALLYAEAEDLVAEHRPEPRPDVSRLSVRQVRELIARLKGDGEEESEEDDGRAPAGPAEAEAEARILARLKRAWDKATGDERSAFLMWAGVGADVQAAYDRGFANGQAKIARAVGEARREGFDEGFYVAARNPGAARAVLDPQAADEHRDEPHDGHAGGNGAAEETADEEAAPRNGYETAAEAPAPRKRQRRTAPLDVDPDDLARRLKEARSARGVSQQKLADELGVPKPAVQRIEAGNAHIAGIDNIAKVLAVLGLS